MATWAAVHNHIDGGGVFVRANRVDTRVPVPVGLAQAINEMAEKGIQPRVSAIGPGAKSHAPDLPECYKAMHAAYRFPMHAEAQCYALGEVLEFKDLVKRKPRLVIFLQHVHTRAPYADAHIYESEHAASTVPLGLLSPASKAEVLANRRQQFPRIIKWTDCRCSGSRCKAGSTQKKDPKQPKCRNGAGRDMVCVPLVRWSRNKGNATYGKIGVGPFDWCNSPIHLIHHLMWCFRHGVCPFQCVGCEEKKFCPSTMDKSRTWAQQ